MFVQYVVSTYLLIKRGQDYTQTNTGKYIGVSGDQYKLYDVTMPTDDVIIFHIIYIFKISILIKIFLTLK